MFEQIRHRSRTTERETRQSESWSFLQTGQLITDCGSESIQTSSQLWRSMISEQTRRRHTEYRPQLAHTKTRAGHYCAALLEFHQASEECPHQRVHNQRRSASGDPERRSATVIDPCASESIS